ASDQPVTARNPAKRAERSDGAGLAPGKRDMFLVLAFRTDHPLDPAYRIPLGDGTLVVGRGPEVLVFPAGPGRRQLALPDLGVSRNHAELRLDSSGQRMAWVTDLGSTNGLFVDGQPTVHAELRPGQLLE